MHQDSGSHTVIEVVSRQRLIEIERSHVASFAADILAEVKRTDADEITIAFVTDRTIRRLNRIYRGKNSATDVLSFPAEEDSLESPALSSSLSRYLGDIVISADAAIRQASQARHSVNREIDELVLHGILHLCGYDHETDDGQMDQLELELRRRLLDRRRRKA